STFGGGPLVSKSAYAVLRAIQKEKLLQNANKMGEYLREKLNSLKERYPGLIKEIRGMGLMLGLELNREGRIVVEECQRRGLLINCTQERVLRIMPALNVTKKQIGEAIKILEEVFKDLK
ncbi:MAG: aminotransferase class III-fold pyridoxal phosphate-dependent enzyme, partial [Candidatus Omnitrophica bacterium]|nr:aminotransferase class III-fold pyridoxal phosphate-dependent enzyme [Candidatus Omnitrophota bacterium]